MEPSPPITSRPMSSALAHPSLPRIVAVGFHRLKQLLHDVAPEYAARASVDVLDRGFEQALAEIDAQRVSHPIDVVVSAGMHGDYLRRRVELPVVMVKVGGYDLMRALAQARALSTRVALVTFGTVRAEVEQFSRRFGLDIVQRSYRNEAQAALCVDELRAAGIEVVVAPGLVADLAEAAGMTGLLLYSPDAVRQAIDDAIEVARTARIAAAKRERLNTIIAQLRDGVVAVDADERIEALNPPIERLLGATREQLLGRRLGELAPELSLQRTLRDGIEDTDEVARLGGRTVVLSRRGIHERGVTTGAVLTCQDPASIQRAERSLRARSTARGARYRLDDIVGDSAPMREARRLAARYAASEATVLIVGESGTGKELFAQGIHAASRRAHQPFVAVNCAAFPEALLESELFGYEEGAFTGARKAGKIGLFEAAHRGTLFLDEIGEMPASLQTRLLRVLQEREILRVGATEPTPIDVRVIAATHRALSERIAAGAFRRDLYYRLNILRLELAALRERAEDLPLLAAHLFDKLSARHGSAPSAALHALLQRARGYDWPGNVRELENMIERVVCAGAAPAELLPELAASTTDTPAASARQLAARAERDAIERVLAECGGNRLEACARLGIGRTTLWRKLRALDTA